MTETGVPMVAVTCRTEYLRPRHRMAVQGAWICTFAALIALVVLNVVGADAAVIVAATGAGLILAYVCASLGRLGARGAVLVTVDDSTLFVGDERHQIVSAPIEAVQGISLGPASQRSSVTGAANGDPTDLTISGARVLTVDIDPERIGRRLSMPNQVEREPIRWRIGVLDGDPAATEVFDRLRRTAPVLPDPPRTKPGAVADNPAETVQSDAASAMRGPSIVDAGSDDAARRLWEDATRRHDAVLGVYGAYELQPDLLLRFPGVTDLTRPAVQDFHRALDEAMALRTDEYPRDRARADEYLQSVNALERVWRTSEKQGCDVGTDYLATSAQDGLATALGLLREGRRSETVEEQARYYAHVHRIVTGLAENGSLHPPQPAVDELRVAGAVVPDADQ